MARRYRDGRDGPLVDEEKEKPRIEWENKVLFILMPSVGLIAFIIGLLGFILVLGSHNYECLLVIVYCLLVIVGW